MLEENRKFEMCMRTWLSDKYFTSLCKDLEFTPRKSEGGK